ncbi:helical membrane plugin domain-containing protein [Desulfonatronum parangueonense]
MSKEDLILKRLDEIEAKVALVHERAVAAQNLRRELQPVMNDAFKLMLHELGDVETGFQLEDSFELLKTMMRNVKNITYTIKQLENVIDLWHTSEPLLKSTVPKAIAYLDDLEQKGVFRTYQAMLGLRAKVAQEYGPEQIEEMGDAFVFLIGMLSKLSDPKVRHMIEKASDAFTELDLTDVQPTGMFGMMKAMSSPEAKQGLGVMVEMTKTLGKLK